MTIKELVEQSEEDFKNIDADIAELESKATELEADIIKIGSGYSLEDTEKTVDLRNKLNLVNQSLQKAYQFRKVQSIELSNDIINKLYSTQHEAIKEFKSKHAKLADQILDASIELRRLIKIKNNLADQELKEYREYKSKLNNLLSDEAKKQIEGSELGFRFYLDLKGTDQDLKIINFIEKESKKNRTFLKGV